MENRNSEITWSDYVRAERFLPWNLEKRIYNAEVTPQWIGKEEEKPEKFWYLNKARHGKEFMICDPERELHERSFDHVRLAAGLSVASGKQCTHGKLPFDVIDWVDGNRVRFKVDETYWECDLDTYECCQVEHEKKKKPGELLSPDEKWAAFRKDFNIYLRNTESGEELQLTEDGEKYFDYGFFPESNTYAVTFRPHISRIPPMAIWSKDSKKLVTQRLDQRRVKDLHLLQSCPPEGQRPVLHAYRYAMVGDSELTKCEVVILDVDKKKTVFADLGQFEIDFMGPVEQKHLWWAEDNQKVYLALFERAYKSVRLYEIDAETGKSRVLMEETGETYVELAPLLGTRPNVSIIKQGEELIWHSERDGWANLYRYNAGNGELINQITSGPFVVWEIKHVDEEGDWIYFMGGAREPDRDPYYLHLYRVKLDGTDLQLLTPQDAHHKVTFSPGGKYFVDTYSRVDAAPVTELRSCDDSQVRILLQEADISTLLEMGWREPE
ncbi:MAG: DPP IV N-terminal domain-containing protein, partial [Anaerolineaceae bacterium]|nr:DPP IV N-terminal domain-containing protein [Anaerolineaceae bacterium]